MSNSEEITYDLSPIKVHNWYMIDDYLIRYQRDIDDYSIFSVTQNGKNITYNFSVTVNLVILSFDLEDLELKNHELFKKLKSLITGYVKRNC